MQSIRSVLLAWVLTLGAAGGPTIIENVATVSSVALRRSTLTRNSGGVPPNERDKAPCGFCEVGLETTSES